MLLTVTFSLLPASPFHPKDDEFMQDVIGSLVYQMFSATQTKFHHFRAMFGFRARVELTKTLARLAMISQTSKLDDCVF